MRNRIRIAAVVVGSLALTVHAQTSSPPPSASTSVSQRAKSSSPFAQTSALPQIPTEPKAYLERLHHAHRMEIEMAALAQEKSKNPQVLQYASMLSRDHQQADTKLMNAARSQQMNLSDPKPMNEMEKKGMVAAKASTEALKAMDGASFDGAWLSAMVTDHDKVLGKLMAGQRAFSRQPFASLIDESIPEVSSHRDQAYQLLGQVKPGGTGVGGSGVDAEMGSEMDETRSQQPGKGM